MSINRYQKQRDKNEGEIIAAFKALGATVECIDTPCDLLMGFNGESFLIEVKTKNGKLTPNQVKFTKGWKGSYFIVRSADEAIELINKIRKQDKQ